MPAKNKRKISQPKKRATFGVVDLTIGDDNETAGQAKHSKVDEEELVSAELQSLLDQASFYLHMRRTDTNITEGSISSYLGEFSICLLSNERCLPQVDELWLYIADDVEGKNFLYQEQRTMLKNHYLVELSSKSVAHLLSRMAVGMSPHCNREAVHLSYKVDHQCRKIHIQVYILNRYIIDLQKYDSYARMSPYQLYSIQYALVLTGHAQLPEISDDKGQVSDPALPNVPSIHHNINVLYAAVKSKPYLSSVESPQLDAQLDAQLGHNLTTPEIHLSRQKLLSKLRPYQLEAVNWMVSKERGLYTAAYEAAIQKLFSPVSGVVKYMNIDSGVVSQEPPHLHLEPGGILADEMGLGKTVEVLTCMVCNHRQDLPPVTPLLVGEYCVMDSAARKCISAWLSKNSKNTRSQSTSANLATGPAVDSRDKSTVDSRDKSTVDSRKESTVDTPNHVTVDSTLPDHVTVGSTLPDHVTVDSTLPDHVTVDSTIPDHVTVDSTIPDHVTVDSTIPDHETVDSTLPDIITNHGGQSSDVSKLSRQSPDACTAATGRLDAFSQLSAAVGATSGVNLVIHSSSKPPKFECTCGRLSPDKVKVQCCMCSLRQHASCVGYDITDPHRGAYKCPHCHVISEPIKSGATLIIAPSSIRHQWREEILKHVGSSHLKVLEYEGVSSKTPYIQPMTLARQDIVITTYDVLRVELRSTTVPHSNSDVGRRFRKPKRFMALPSPLTAVQWWRVCLDEAQMVESVTTATSEMALKLSAVNRWCVTGTPVNTSVGDLYGLLVFLSVKPFFTRMAWEGFIYRPYCFGRPQNLYTVLQHVMWRTCKDDVRDQLGLPDQTEVVHEVMFSPVEEVFYRQMYSVCRERFMKILAKHPDKHARLDSLSGSDVSLVLQAFLGMRQACCYPQLSHVGGAQVRTIVRAPKKSGDKTKKVVIKSTLTMEQLLQQMTKKVHTECEDAQRCIVAALNGQAACHLMKQEFKKAVETYLEVLNPSTKCEDVKTDSLQLIHATHNLREVLLMDKDNSPDYSHIDIEKLSKDKEELSNKYLEKSLSAATSLMSSYESLSRAVFNHSLMNSELIMWKCWWHHLIHNLDYDKIDLLSQVNTTVSQFNSPFAVFSSLIGLCYQLINQWKKMVTHHTAAREAIDQLVKESMSKSMVEEVVNCCLRPDPAARLPDSKCPYCKTEALLKQDEYHIFDFTDRYFDEDGEEQRKGTWADSVTESLLKTVLSYFRLALSNKRKGDSSDMTLELEEREEREEREKREERLSTCERNLEIASEHMNLLNDMKKQFKVMRVLWRRLRETIAATDELSMATLKFRLRESWETTPKKADYVVEKHELEQLHIKQIMDLSSGEGELTKALRQLNYLKHIGSQPIDAVCGNTELCPICQQGLGHSWAVLTCCHSFCADCLQALTSQHSCLTLPLLSRRTIRCAVCREYTRLHDVSYVSSGKTMCRDLAVEVKGDYSSKVMEVIRCLKTIEKDEPEAKVLVFSTWTSLLDVIKEGLLINDIAYRQLSGGKQGKGYEQQINSFRRTSGIEVLLLPISSGANGLNLVEATHVILLEPLLHPGKEAQAIGRIHRIGQTKPTFVHRFIVKHSIEERIHTLLSTIGQTDAAAVSSLDEMPLTLADLAEIFDSSI